MESYQTAYYRAQKLVREAFVAVRRGDTERGEQLLVEALEHLPVHAEALYQLAALRAVVKHDFDSAMELVSSCLAVEPRHPLAYALRGRLRHERGDFGGALADFDAGLRLSPDDVEILLGRGMTLVSLGRKAEALACYERIMRLAPGDARPYCNRALLLGDSDPDAAIADFSAAIQRDPRHADAYLGRGFHRHARGERREALQDFQEAVRLVRFDKDHPAVEAIRQLHWELAAAGGPPVHGLRANVAWVERGGWLSETVDPHGLAASQAPASGDEGLIVPEGHKVVTVHPTRTPRFGRAESGVWIADLGDGTGDLEEVIGRVMYMAVEGKPAFVVWILQPTVLRSPIIFDNFLAVFDTFVHQWRGTVEHCVVVSRGDDRDRVQMKRLADLGVSVHHSAEDGECFVEVHKPDRIVIGVPGTGFDAAADVPRDLDTLIRDMADRRNPDDHAELFARLRSQKLVFSIVGGGTDHRPRGVRIDGGGLQIPVATVEDMDVAVAYASGAHPDLGEERCEMEGEEALRMVLEIPNADGLLIQSTGTGWLVIPRKRISELLATGG
jgi:tetratricopeptide (TPR) repeat protein